LAIFREDLESVIPAIAYNHVTLPSHANAARHPQLTCESTMLAKGREKHTVGAKNLQNALENGIREDHGCEKHAVGAWNLQNAMEKVDRCAPPVRDPK
jgi:hypothetical protein